MKSILYKSEKIWILIFFLTCTISLQAQIVLNQRKIEKTIGNRLVNSIDQDSVGFMWIGTEEGLFRFDGYDFSHYKHSKNDSFSLSDNFIYCLVTDHYNNLWIATANGLNRMNLSRPGIFYRFMHDSLDDNSIVDNDTRVLFLDSKNFLWIGTYNNGVSRISFQQTDKYRVENFPYFRNKINSTMSPSISSIAESEDNRLFLGTIGNGLIEYLHGQNKFIQHHISGYDSNTETVRFITDIKIYKNYLWISTYRSGFFPIKVSDISSRSTDNFIKTKFFNYNNSPKKLSYQLNKINTILPGITLNKSDNSGVLLGTNNSGIKYFDTEQKKILTIKRKTSTDKEFENDLVYSIFQDRTGNIWVGSDNGISSINSYNPKIIHLQNEENNPQTLSSNNITSLQFGRNNSLWIGTENGINKYETNSKLKNAASPVQRFINPGGNFYISDIYVENKNNILLSTYGFGIRRLNIKSDQDYKFTPVAIKALQNLTEPIRFITKIEKDNFERYWVGSLEGLVILVKDKQTNKFKIDNGLFKKLPRVKQTINVYKDKRGNMWLCTYGNGIFYVKFSNDSLLAIQKFSTNNGLSDDKVLSVLQDFSGKYWIGTSSGLNLLDLESGEIQQFLEKDGLSNSLIYGILNDENNNIWVSTNYGLSKCSIAKNGKYVFQNYFKKDGLQENEYNVRAYAKGKNGVLAFGGINGVNIFDPSSIQLSDFSPPLVLTKFFIFNQEYKPDSTINETKHITLQYDQKLFSIEFAALEYNTPEKVKYNYKLQGFDSDWIENGNRRFATYTNLDPGNYKFKVRASIDENKWSTNLAQLQITIAPPFWQTWWFRIFVFLIVVFILWSLHRFRINRLLEMERLRIQIASDLHDEIGSSLSKISMYSDLAAKPLPESEKKPLLAKIGNTSRDLVKTMSDIVWSVDARKDHLGGLIDRMRDTASDLLNAKNISFDFKVQNINRQQKISALNRQNIYLILKEAITNIAKHSAATNVIIIFEHSKNKFNLTISDNGCGFAAENKFSGNGIRNMNLRANRINGKFEIENSNGTIIKLILEKI